MKTTPERAAQELNTVRQLVTNWTGQVLTSERADKIVRHATLILTHVRADRARYALRLQVFTAYGARCVCCGETDTEKLTLDHITPRNGRRRRDPYKQAIAQGFPRDKFQVMCRRCNSRKGTGARCPCGQEQRSPVARVVRLVRRE